MDLVVVAPVGPADRVVGRVALVVLVADDPVGRVVVDRLGLLRSTLTLLWD